jgi:two-component sensor histidine kinase
MLSGLKFRGKLALAIVPAMVAIAVLAWAAVAPRLTTSSQASTDLQRIEAANALGTFFNEVQIELGLSTRETVNPAIAGELGIQRTIVDDRVAAALAALDRTELPERSTEIEAFRVFVQKLPQLRSAVDSTSRGLGITATAGQFTDGMDVTIGSIRELSTATNDADLLRRSNALAVQLQGKESYGTALAIIAGYFEAGDLAPSDVPRIETQLQDFESNYAQFAEVAASSDVDRLRAIEASEPVANLDNQIEAILANAAAGNPSGVNGAWWAASVPAIAEYDKLSQQMFDEYRAAATEARDSSRRSAVLFVILAALAALIAATLAALIGRDLVRRVRQISQDANTIAVDRLPDVLETLRNPTPEALAGALPQVASRSTDEIGSLATSFNTVLRTAVETSMEHAARRSETLTNLLINLGRRNQAIIERQLELIDSLESREQQPEVLEGLFKLDHMVTRQRRNAESLLVLAGSRRSRAWTAAVLTSDVIQGAVSEVTDMHRVAFEMAPGHDVAVAGQYAVDLSHLLAELIENATLYSNPATKVVVRAQRNGSGLRMWVIDNGVGMADDELDTANLRVNDPPEIDEITTDQVGFQVVGRLAQRLNARVRLQNNPAGGVAVSVDLPSSVFEVISEDVFDDDAPDSGPDDDLLVAHTADIDLDDLDLDEPDQDLDRELHDLVVEEPSNSALPRRGAGGSGRSAQPPDDAAASTTDAAPLPRRVTAGQSSPAAGAATHDEPAPAVAAEAERTAAGLAKRRPGAALGGQRPAEPVGLFTSNDTTDGDDEVAEARMRSLRAFSRGVGQGRGDAS